MSLNIKFGASTWLWTSHFNSQALTLFPKIKRMGFDIVEIPVKDPAHIDTTEIKEAPVEYDLQPVISGVFGITRDLTHDDPSYHNNSFKYIESCMNICNRLAAGFLAGPMYSVIGKARPASSDQKKREWDRHD